MKEERKEGRKEGRRKEGRKVGRNTHKYMNIYTTHAQHAHTTIKVVVA